MLCGDCGLHQTTKLERVGDRVGRGLIYIYEPGTAKGAPGQDLVSGSACEMQAFALNAHDVPCASGASR